jgi:peptidoglycan hydrolase-like protein with peptidoglycan-binding domain
MRLLVAAFLAIATAISVNALYFQAPRLAALGTKVAAQQKEAPGPAKAGEQTRPLVTAALPAKPAADTVREKAAATPQKPVATPSSADLVKAIQKKLAHFGYKTLPQDGQMGPETRAAILSAEFEQGMPLTGQPGDAVLSALYFLEASGRSSLASSDRFERDPKLIKEVQDLLAKLGYTSGPINGKLDAWTRDAIRKFETDRRLTADGRLSERILLEMVIEKGEPFLSKG